VGEVFGHVLVFFSSFPKLIDTVHKFASE
jgi:hypothetical protein